MAGRNGVRAVPGPSADALGDHATGHAAQCAQQALALRSRAREKRPDRTHPPARRTGGHNDVGVVADGWRVCRGGGAGGGRGCLGRVGRGWPPQARARARFRALPVSGRGRAGGRVLWGAYARRGTAVTHSAASIAQGA